MHGESQLWFLSLPFQYKLTKLFFRECLSGTIENSDSPQVGCPYKDDNYSCDMVVLEREIKAVSQTVQQSKIKNKLMFCMWVSEIV